MKQVHLWRLAPAVLIATLAVLSLSALAATARPLSGNTYTVGGVCGATIQTCIDQATGGDTVLVPPGTYHEWLWLNKPVSLIGAGAATTIVQTPDPTRKPLTIYGSTPATITSTTVISGLTFTGYDQSNSTAGGGILLMMPSSPTIQNVIVTGNRSSEGAGLAISSGAAPTLINVVITGNTAIGDMGIGGSAVYMDGSGSVRMINSLIADNPDNSGRGQIEVAGGTLTLLHTTIANATRASGAGLLTTGGTALLTNTIIANQTYGVHQMSGSIRGDYNLYFNNTTNYTGTSSGLHDRVGDPVFVNPAAGNYHVHDTSAAIDHGVNAGIALDFDGDARPFGAGFDIGFDEHRMPAIALTLPLATQIVSSTNLLIVGQTNPADQMPQVEVSLDGGVSWMAAVGTTTFTYTWTVPLEDGVPHMILARGTDHTGNMAHSAPVTVTVDRIAPQTSILDPLLGQIIRGHAYTLSGKDQDGLGVSKVQVSTNNGSTWADTVLGDRVWSYNWTIPDEDGVSHLLRLAGTDVAGNFSAPLSTVAVFVDNVPPLISFSNLPVGGVTTILSHTFTVVGTSSGALSTTLDWGGVPQAVSVVNNVFTRTLSLPSGTYTLRGVAVDAAGNSSAITTTLIVVAPLPGPYRLWAPVVFFDYDPIQDQYEADDTFATAHLIAADGSLQRRNFYPANDVDWVRLEAAPGTYLISTSGLTTDTDTVLRLYAANGVTRLAENDDCTPYTRASCLTWTASAATTLFIQLTPYNSQSIGADRWYDLSVVIP